MLRLPSIPSAKAGLSAVDKAIAVLPPAKAGARAAAKLRLLSSSPQRPVRLASAVLPTKARTRTTTKAECATVIPAKAGKMSLRRAEAVAVLPAKLGKMGRCQSCGHCHPHPC